MQPIRSTPSAIRLCQGRSGCHPPVSWQASLATIGPALIILLAALAVIAPPLQKSRPLPGDNWSEPMRSWQCSTTTFEIVFEFLRPQVVVELGECQTEAPSDASPDQEREAVSPHMVSSVVE